eukprot:tig00020807_g14055.t1
MSPARAPPGPQELVGTLSALFAEFDRAARARGLEPLKTLGDAVLAGAFPRRRRPAAPAASRRGSSSSAATPSASNAKGAPGLPARRRSSVHPLPLAAGGTRTRPATAAPVHPSRPRRRRQQLKRGGGGGRVGGGAESSGESDAGGGEWGGEGEVERALQYALDCRDILASFVGPAGHRLQMRFGVAVGPAVGAILGRQRWSYEVWGPAVSEAQEREAASQPQEILVSREVYEAARGAFEFELRDGLPFLLRRTGTS